QGAGEGPGEVGEGRIGRGRGDDGQDVAGGVGRGGGHREARGRCRGGEGHRADRGAVLLDRERGGGGGGGAGRTVAAGEPGREADRGGENVALDDLAGGRAARPGAGDIGGALDGAVAGQAVAGRGQSGEPLQRLT